MAVGLPACMGLGSRGRARQRAEGWRSLGEMEAQGIVAGEIEV